MKTVHIPHDLKNVALLQLLKTPPFKLRYFHISIYAPSQYNFLCIFYFFFIKGKKLCYITQLIVQPTVVVKKKITGKVIFSICADIYNHDITQNIIVKYYTHYVFQ